MSLPLIISAMALDRLLPWSGIPPGRLPPWVTRFGRAWPTWFVMIPENWYSLVRSARAGPNLGPKSTGLVEASDMLLGWALLAACARAFESVGDEGVLNTCFVAMGGLSTSSMLRTGFGGGGLSTSSILLTGAMSSMLRTGERGV